jgi:alpha-tubulin suppressor-like RCC1 family protein
VCCTGIDCCVVDLAGEVIQSVHCGASHSMAVVKRTGRVYTWGKNTQGQCGRGNLEDILRPMINTTLKNDNIVKVCCYIGSSAFYSPRCSLACAV